MLTCKNIFRKKNFSEISNSFDACEDRENVIYGGIFFTHKKEDLT